MLDKFISQKLKEVAERLPTLVHTDPASFSCGYNTGYKQALLDIERKLNDPDYQVVVVKDLNENEFVGVFENNELLQEYVESLKACEIQASCVPYFLGSFEKNKEI